MPSPNVFTYFCLVFHGAGDQHMKIQTGSILGKASTKEPHPQSRAANLPRKNKALEFSSSLV